MIEPLTEDDIGLLRAGLYRLGGSLVMSATEIDALVEKLRAGSTSAAYRQALQDAAWAGIDLVNTIEDMLPADLDDIWRPKMAAARAAHDALGDPPDQTTQHCPLFDGHAAENAVLREQLEGDAEKFDCVADLLAGMPLDAVVCEERASAIRALLADASPRVERVLAAVRLAEASCAVDLSEDARCEYELALAAYRTKEKNDAVRDQ